MLSFLFRAAKALDDTCNSANHTTTSGVVVSSMLGAVSVCFVREVFMYKCCLSKNPDIYVLDSERKKCVDSRVVNLGRISTVALTCATMSSELDIKKLPYSTPICIAASTISVVLLECVLLAGFQGFKIYDQKRDELMRAKEAIEDLRQAIRVLQSEENITQSALISVRRDNNRLKRELQLLTSGNNIHEFTVPDGVNPGDTVTIMASDNGLRRQVIIPEHARPGIRLRYDFTERAWEKSPFTKEEIEDIMNGIFTVSNEIKNGRYIELNNKLKKLYDNL
tara:strand:- start:164 stop:1003 length:840 start_codon:yes stop_codon:yes gene_type:complete